MPEVALVRLHGGVAPPPGPRPPQLLVTVRGRAGPAAGESGLSVFGLPPTTAGGADGGIGLAPYAEGEAELRLPLDSRLSLGMAAGAELGSGFAVVLRPGADPALRTGLNEETAGRGAAGARLAVDLTRAAREGEDPMTLFAAGPASLRARSLGIALESSVDGGGADAGVRLIVAGGRVEVTGDGVPFVEDVLPSGGAAVDVDFDLSWSHRAGVRFDGSAELRTRRAVGHRIGPVTIDAAELALAAAGGALSADASVTATVELGPARITIEGLGLRAAIDQRPGALGAADLAVRPRAPTGLGLAIDAGPVTGGGFLALRSRARASTRARCTCSSRGSRSRAVGLLTTRLPGGKPGFSLLVIVSRRVPAGAARARLHAGRRRRAARDQPHRRGRGAARRVEDRRARRGALAARPEGERRRSWWRRWRGCSRRRRAGTCSRRRRASCGARRR